MANIVTVNENNVEHIDNNIEDIDSIEGII